MEECGATDDRGKRGLFSRGDTMGLREKGGGRRGESRRE
jgi:hypothetical protein